MSAAVSAATAASNSEITIDVREMAPRQRHPTIFATWDNLPDGASLMLVNDHDPIPLYYQFAVEYVGQFHWEYVERGPALWRVRISRGTFADPGFKPQPGERGSCHVKPQPIEFVSFQTLDVRPILAAGGSPCGPIEQAISKLIPGQSLVILVPFEPIPLYTKLGMCGFGHEAEQLPDGTWRVVFKPNSQADPEKFQPCGCGGHED